MQVTVNVPDQLAAQARARGVSVEAYVEQVLARDSQMVSNEARLQEIGGAIDRLLELRKKSKLCGLRIKDLIHEGHKY
jgi:hypothetical protein